MEDWKTGSLEVNEKVIMNKEEIIHILSEVKDPEIPVLTISDLGILRAVEYENDIVQIQITPTYSGCPAMEVIQEDIRTELARYGLRHIEIKQVLSPAWTTDWMSEAGKQKLVAFGIAAPAIHTCFLSGEDKPESCPLCHSKNIEMISRFGSTACKALYRCLDCQEPFDYFKCH
ncbi:MAG TPA: 1,2-phenylacetyl-CoA epoxidase subunit PaaD [Puia sp.]|jgi:ring-1,2-phenylacetyl-CoA epoxidase subunit PaaD